MNHSEDRHVHTYTVPLDPYGTINGPHKGLGSTYGGDHDRPVHFITYGPVGPVLKYTLCLLYRVPVTVPVAEILKAPG